MTLHSKLAGINISNDGSLIREVAHCRGCFDAANYGTSEYCYKQDDVIHFLFGLFFSLMDMVSFG